MRERNLRVLEFLKIRDMLKEYAVSELGRERVDQLEPSSDLNVVRRWQQETEEAGVVVSYAGASPMLYFADVRPHLRRAAIGATLSQKALLDVAELLRASRGVRQAIVTDRENTPLITALGSGLTTDRPLEEEIFDAILSEEEINDRASPELYEIRRHMRLCNERMRDKMNALIRSASMQKHLQDAIITMRNGRYVIPVRAESRQFVPGLIHDQSASGATLFIEPMAVVEAGNDLKQWASKEAQEIERILAALSARVSPRAEALNMNLVVLAELDMIFAKAALGRAMRAVEPKLNDQGRVNIVAGRHPLIDPDAVVPSNLWIGGEFSALVITGPNTGGKTVTLKTVGLLTLMAQAGLKVPASLGTELSVFDEVFADIGDEQSIEQSLSTFSSHMKNIVDTLAAVTPRSLALFDELGAGTDPTEGAALAISILEKLRASGVTAMATTHYSELKAYALTTRGVENASVEFDVATLRPTYRLSIGIPGKSNAFEISRRLGLSEEIIRDASERLSKDQIRFEDVIANAEYHRQVAEKERALAEQAHRETQKLLDEADRLKKELAEQREGMIKKAREESRRVIAQAQREAEQVISELKRARAADGGTLKEHEILALRGRLQGAMGAASEPLAPGAERAGEPLTEVKAGDAVELAKLGVRAIVLEPPGSDGEALVQAGAMKMKVKLRDLRRAAPEPKKKKVGSSHVSVETRPAAMDVDVRGLTLDEAIGAVDLFLDGCAMQSRKLAQIIHGKGTGVLRAGI
ncbi:MAG: endonuclease MutS2, partial [Clostridiales bacterium]|nr:endonuclease MutS2 [Clostridiales bacterium]